MSDNNISSGVPKHEKETGRRAGEEGTSFSTDLIVLPELHNDSYKIEWDKSQCMILDC